MRDFSANILALLDSLGIERAVIAGHSMGSTIARRSRSITPERVRGLVLGSARSRPSRASPRSAELTAIAAELSGPDRQGDFAREFQESTLARPIPPSFMETIGRRELQGARRRLPGGDRRARRGRRVARSRPRTAHRVLIVWGDQDAYCPRADQDAIAGALPGARLSVFAGSGHAPQWEQAERAAKEIAAFAAGVL